MKEIKKTEKAAQQPRFWLGFLAGVAGGLAGTAATLVAEKIYPPLEPGPAEPHEVFGERASTAVAMRSRGQAERETAVQGIHETPVQGIHWTFGAMAGGVYGMLAEIWPRVTEGNGTAFGMALNFALHGETLPILLSPPKEKSGGPHGSEITSLAVFGMTAEFVRKHTRSWLESREAERRRDVAQRNERHAA